MNIDTKKSIKKILTFYLATILSIALAISGRVLSGEDDLIESLTLLGGLFAFIPYMAIQTVLFSNVNRMNVRI